MASAEVDASLGLIELPPIRVPAALYEFIKKAALDRELIIQANVRAVLAQVS